MQNSERVTNTAIYNYLSGIILSYNNHNNNEVSGVLVELYNDLCHNIEDTAKYEKENFIVRKMVENLKKIASRDSVLKYYSRVIQMNLEQTIGFTDELRQSLKDVIAKIETPENSFSKSE